MKVRPDLPERDPCQTSIDWIGRRVVPLLQERRGAQSVWLPDGEPIPPVGREVTDVVLTGGFLRRFLESGNWPAGRYRLWTVSSAVREILIHMLGLPASCVGRIPRGEISRAASCPVISRQGNFGWVFAGRLSRTKNIEGLLRTVSFLQTEQGIPAPLSLVGDFDAAYHPDGGRREVGSAANYESAIRALIERLPWIQPPRLNPRMGEESWVEGFRESPVFISLSTFLSEDFGVAQAQAAEAGWPSWLSDWGGHRDAEARKIHPLFIPRAHDPSAVQSLKARLLARRIAEEIRTPPATLAPTRNDWVVPDSVHASSLDECRRAWLRASREQAQTILRHGLEFFADTPYGRSFFGRYRLYMQGSIDSLREISFDALWINDLNARADVACRRAREEAEAAVDLAMHADLPLALLAVRDLDLKDIAAAAACARQMRTAVPASSLGKWSEAFA